MSRTDIAILVILSILFGGSFFFVEILIKHLPPLTIVTSRVGFAALGLWALVFALKLPLPNTAQQWRALFVVGFLNNALPFCLIVWGQTKISSGLASIFNATTPFFTILVAGALLADERITRQKLLGVVVGFSGVVMLIGPEILGGLSGSVLGQLAVIAAALSYAFAAAYARRFKQWRLPPLIVATGQVTMATLILLPISFMIDGPPDLSAIPIGAIGAIAGLAFFSTVLAYILYFHLIDTAGAGNAALVAFLVPISAIILGVAFLGEPFTAQLALGMGLIGSGLLIMDGRAVECLQRAVATRIH